MREMRNTYIVLGKKPEGKRQRGRPRRRWEGNIKTDLIAVWWEGVDWTNFAQDRGQ
jgi:hypothetical protein